MCVQFSFCIHVACVCVFVFVSFKLSVITLCHGYNSLHFTLLSISPDINECELDLHTCNPETSQCLNTEGAYKCFCKKGFKLSSDGKTCEGT